MQNIHSDQHFKDLYMSYFRPSFLLFLSLFITFNSLFAAPPEEPKNIYDGSFQFLEIVNGKEFTAEYCAPFLNSVYAKLFKSTPYDHDVEKIAAKAPAIISNMWKIRLSLRKKLQEFYKSGNASRECVDAVRNANRASRFIEEYLIEWHYEPPVYDANNPSPFLQGNFPYLKLNPEQLPKEKIEKNEFIPLEDLKSGDLVLTRGNAYVSAAIARLGNQDGQFSHLSIVYIDEETQEKYTVEAHIEVGVRARPLDSGHLLDGNMRAIVFRYQKDPELAHRAAKLVYEKAVESTQTVGNIPYDFQANMEDRSELFCSEVAQYAYAEASDGKLLLPSFITSLNKNNRYFPSLLGITGDLFFAPADMEVEPNFEIIAEWVDPSRVSDTRMKDAVLTKMYEWMENKNYEFHSTTFSIIVKYLAYYLRRTPIIGYFMEHMFPLNMEMTAIETTILLDSVAETIYNQVKLYNELRIKDTSLPLTVIEMYNFMENLRKEDLTAYENGESPLFHYIFRPAM